MPIIGNMLYLRMARVRKQRIIDVVTHPEIKKIVSFLTVPHSSSTSSNTTCLLSHIVMQVNLCGTLFMTFSSTFGNVITFGGRKALC